jgi:hypothetical protein
MYLPFRNLRLENLTCFQIESSRRLVKKIKLEMEGSRPSTSRSPLYEEVPRPPSPEKSSRVPQATPNTPLVCICVHPSLPSPANPLILCQTKEARARMEEMRAMIGRRQAGELAPVGRSRTNVFDASRSHSSPVSDESSRRLEDLISDADRNLAQAMTHHDELQGEFKNLAIQYKEVGHHQFSTHSEQQTLIYECRS